MVMNEQIRYIRESFHKKYAENIARGIYDIRDLQRLQNDTTFVKTNIRSEERLDEAADLIHSSLKFRKEMKVNDLHEDMFDRELLELGGMYFHNKDISGHRILWLKIKVHRKDVPTERLAMEKLAFIFFIEKAFTESPLHQVVVLLDMTSCGLSNLDIDFVKYIISIFRYYYPTFLEYMLIYDMPWIFNVAWKVIRASLNAEMTALIKFVTKADIQSYIAAADLPPRMGGTDTFEYSYTPGMASGPLYADTDGIKADKKVHFQEAQEHSAIPPSPGASTSSSDTDSSVIDRPTTTAAGQRHRTHSHGDKVINSHENVNNNFHGNVNNAAADKQRSAMLVRSASSPNANTRIGRLLTVSPADELVFDVKDDGDSFDTITLTNTLPDSVAFKVKTTSPEKFRVRPSSGIIKPDRTEEIRVHFISDHAGDISKEKFLIMAIETQGKSADLNQLFKDAPIEKVMQHKLKCSLGPHHLQQHTSGSQNGKTLEDPLASKVHQLELQAVRMRKQLNLLLVFQFLTVLILLLMALLYSCFGEDLFTHFRALPFDYCQA